MTIKEIFNLLVDMYDQELYSLERHHVGDAQLLVALEKAINILRPFVK